MMMEVIYSCLTIQYTEINFEGLHTLKGKKYMEKLKMDGLRTEQMETRVETEQMTQANRIQQPV